MLKKLNSNHAFWIVVLVILSTHFFYYPKWNKAGTEATISWDVSGYYYYLPALFIYKDIQQLNWKDSIQQKYQPASSMYQAFKHESGVYVMKYSAGLAIQYLPFFAIGHMMATLGPWDADGFSFPYQLMISLGSLLIALIGIFFLRKILLVYFKDWIAAWTIVLIALGTNYLNYSAIDGAMTHNYLFTLYALLIWSTIRFYQQPNFSWSIMIGILVGLCALTRPTEIVLAAIPLLWGVASKEALLDRWNFILKNKSYFLLATGLTIIVGSLQIVYWKSVSGDWVVYSYQDQGFSWLKPHLADGFFSYKKGWLIYSPVMGFSLLGFIELFKNRRNLFTSLAIACALIIYITFAWDIWWYGGSLGQRALVQSYALFAFPLAAFIEWIYRSKKYIQITTISVLTLFIYYNLWLTHQAHKGGLLDPENMTKAYFWNVLGKYDQPIEVKKLLDNDEAFNGSRNRVSILFQSDFEQDSISVCTDQPIEGTKSLCIGQENQFSPVYPVDLRNGDAEWIRASATIKAPFKEWDVWKMTQMMIRFYNEDHQVKQKLIRLHRLIYDGQVKQVYLDAKCPKKTFNRVELLFWNGGSSKPMYIDNIILEKFDG